MANLLASQGQLDAAFGEYVRSLELYPTAPAWIGIGRIHGSRRRWREASDAFAAAIALDPENAAARAFAGRAWLELGRPDLARSALERAVELAPANLQIREQLRRAIAAEASDP